MRVSMKYNDIPDPCESFQWGEVEDYVVVIGAGTNSSNSEGDNPIIYGSDGNGNGTLSIYPNPVKGNTLNIKVLQAKPTDYTLYNMLGQVVAKGAFTETLDVSQLPSGAYMLEINGDQKFVERFIKE